LDASGPFWLEFVAELSRLGYREGTNIVFEYRLSLDVRDLERVAVAMAKEGFDLIFTEGGPTAIAAKKATSTVPIVFFASPDPVGLRLVETLARPEANLTGSSIQAWQTNAKEIQLFAEACGKLSNVAVLVPHGADLLPEYPQVTAIITNAANALGIRVQFVSYESVRQLGPIVERLRQEGVDGVALPDAPLREDYRRLAELLIKLRLPSIGETANGYLLSYGFSPAGIARIAAKQVAQLLRGAKPAQVPVEQISSFELLINLRTAKALGLSIPSSLLLQATRLVE
jgi:putative ABC transport system substrate-binding protein